MYRRSRRQSQSVMIGLALGVATLLSGCALTGVPQPLSVLTAAIEESARTPGPGTAQSPTSVPAATTPPSESTTGGRSGLLGGGLVTFDPPPKRGAFTLDLYRRDAHVGQYTASWCVGASMQMMMNLMEPRDLDRTRTTQARLYRLAREISPWEEDSPGASIYGWIGGLEQYGYGDFEEMAGSTLQETLQVAARQMRLTGKPVGLWVWRGRHAWVMSGFKATADPALTESFRVTSVWIEDPWAGRVSTIWGRGLEPHTLLSTRELGDDFLRFASRHRPEYGSKGKYVLIAPVA